MGFFSCPKSTFNGRKVPLPTIFVALPPSGVKLLEALRSRGKNYLTGAYVEHISQGFPIQLLLRLYPYAKSFLLPYSSESHWGRINYEVKRIKSYCNLRGISVQDWSYDGAIRDQDLQKVVKSVDVITTLEGGMPSSDIAYLESFCQKNNKPFVGDGLRALERGGIYGLKEDYRFLGSKVAEMSERILIHNENPIGIDPYMVKCSRKLVGNNDTLSSSNGIFLADDIVADIDGKVSPSKDLPLYISAYSMGMETALALSLYFGYCQQMDKDQNAEYVVRSYDGWPSNSDFMGGKQSTY